MRATKASGIEKQLGRTERVIVDYLRKSGAQLPVEELRKAVNLRHDAVECAVRRLYARGVLLRSKERPARYHCPALAQGGEGESERSEDSPENTRAG